MSILTKLSSLFSRSTRHEELLREAIEHAKENRPAKAIEIYNSLLDSSGASTDLRARVLFNRALAHSSLRDDDRALTDLTQLLAMPGLPDKVVVAARSQLARVKKRNERRADPI
jgi:hypothetical protein